MVKNTIGGKKTKACARKGGSDNHSSALRLPQDELECFAKVTKMFGNSMCQVSLLHNNLSLIAHIRAKMSGKNKRHFNISLNDFIIVGLRHWESSPKHCDIIHLFSQSDLIQLYSIPSLSSIFNNDYHSNLTIEHINNDDDIDSSFTNTLQHEFSLNISSISNNQFDFIDFDSI